MSQLIEKLQAILGHDAVLSAPDELMVYECDGLPHHKHRPRAVVFPSSTEETAAVMLVLAKAGVPFTPRGAGTGLSGGALALDGGVVIEMARMRRILQIDPQNRLAVVQPGVVNTQVSKAAAPFGLHYVPDPSSQGACTIGGNIAENAGGIHCLKYGTTTDHVLGVTAVLSGGEIVKLGGPACGLDLLGPYVGSEGTFGITTEATLRLVPIPPAVRTLLADFLELDNASRAVSAIIAAGVIPAALEMMDQEIIRAVEASPLAAGLPTDAGAALLIELDGIEAGIDEETERLQKICAEQGARSCRLARDENERKKLWAARKGAFGAISRIAPDSMVQDAVVPRSRLPEVLAAASRIAAKYQLRIANVFHAGDGNLHPLICFDSRSADEVRRVKEAGRELMEVCVGVGGSITGEHGVGLDKRDLLPLIFSDDDMDAMLRVRAAYDPLGILNPGKVIPMLRGCGEGRAVASVSDNGNGIMPSPGPRSSRPSSSSTENSRSNGKGSAEIDSLGQASDPVARLAVAPDIAPAIAAVPIERELVTSPVTDSSTDRSEINFTSVTPDSVEELCETLKRAAAEGRQVTSIGGGSWIDLNRLDRSAIVLSTARLNRIIEHVPADLIATAEAGVTLRDFNDELSKRGQWLPLDPPDDGRATIGGVVATGLAGAQQCGYGPVRSFVIGMRVALANGRTIKVGGRVVKNVAGYDLCKLFTGSYGLLGVILEVTFKVRPRPQAQTTVVGVGPAGDLLSGARRILEQRLFPVGLEILSPMLARELDIGIEADQCLLMSRFAGNAIGVPFQCEQATNALASESAVNEIATITDDEVLWNRLAANASKHEEHLVYRTTIEPSLLPMLLSGLQESGIPLWHGNIAGGQMRMLDERPESEAASSLRQVTELARTLNGSISLESGFCAPNSPDRPVHSDAPLDLLGRRVKQQLDPLQLFRPGRRPGSSSQLNARNQD